MRPRSVSCVSFRLLRRLARACELAGQSNHELDEGVSPLPLQVLLEGLIFTRSIGRLRRRVEYGPLCLALPPLFLLTMLVPPIGRSPRSLGSRLDVVHKVGLGTHLEE